MPRPPRMYSIRSEGSIVAADTPFVTAMQRTAVVADPDAGRLESSAAALRAAGYLVHTALDAEALFSVLDGGKPSVLVVDSSLSPRESRVPVLVLVDLNDSGEIAAVEGTGVRDCIAKPPAAKELVHRATALINLVERRTRARQEAEALREQLRQVSAAVRGTNDPQQIADYVVTGFGETFGADHVWLTTFEDERVPAITAQWSRPGLDPLPVGPLEDEAAARSTADLLWARAEVLTTDGSDGSIRLPKSLEDLHAKASVVVPDGGRKLVPGHYVDRPAGQPPGLVTGRTGTDPARGGQRRPRADPKPPDQQPAAGGQAAPGAGQGQDRLPGHRQP